MSNKKRCIVSFWSYGRENYKSGLFRLINLLNYTRYDGDIIAFSPDFSDVEAKSYKTLCGGDIYFVKGMPNTEKYGMCSPHKDAPYQFKSFAIQYAIEAGYTQIAWMDTSITPLKNFEHYWELVSETGVILFDNPGCREDIWTSDDCLQIIGCSVDQARHIQQIDAAIMFFDFTTDKAVECFYDYAGYCLSTKALKGEAKSDRLEFRDHRHDQSIMSYIAYSHDVIKMPYGCWSYYDGFVNNSFPSICFCKTGLVQATYEEIVFEIEGKNT